RLGPARDRSLRRSSEPIGHAPVRASVGPRARAEARERHGADPRVASSSTRHGRPGEGTAMTAAATKQPSSPWKPSFRSTRYRRTHDLTAKERAAIVTHVEGRSARRSRRGGVRELPDAHLLAPLLRPVRDALDLIGSAPKDRNATLDVLLHE